MKKEIVLDEVLIRFRDGVFSGAHVVYLEKFMEDDGTIVFSKMSNPVTLNQVEGNSDEERELFASILNSKIISETSPIIENSETYQPTPIPDTVPKQSFWNKIFGAL